MEICPKCKKMTAERNHYTKELICYNRFCEQQTMESKKDHAASKKELKTSAKPSSLKV